MFELKNDVLAIESITNNQGKSTSTTIELARVALPSIRTAGRDIKTLKGGVNILVLITVIAISGSSIFPEYSTWIWTGALILALIFLPALLQSLKITESEIFKDSQGRPLFDVRCGRGHEAEFEAFLKSLNTVIEQRQRSKADEPPAAAVDTPVDGAEAAAIPPPLPQTRAPGNQALSDLTPADEALIKRITTSARWLYWVAALSGINVLFAHLNVDWRFAVGLGITELIYAVGMQFGSIGTVVGALLTIIAICCLIGLGYAAARRHSWAFILGIIALSLDTLLLIALTGMDFFIGIAIHVVAIVYLCLGCNALRRFEKSRMQEGFGKSE